MSLNRMQESFMVREKPMAGDIVSDASGTSYEVIEVGSRYLSVKHTDTGKSFTLPVRDAYIIKKRGMVDG